MYENSDSDGEELIKEFLEETDIKFKREQKIADLKGDFKPYRTADFYLPEYKVYVEFFGLWNIEKSRKDYQKKREIYEKNKIPCIYIYPDNLGILNFIFKRRLKKVLKKYDMKWQLFKCNYSIFQEKYLMQIVILGALIIYLDNILIRGVLALLILNIVYHSYREIFKNLGELQRTI